MPDRAPVFGRRKPVERRGGTAAARDHSTAFARRRAALMAAEPLCRYCFHQGAITAATVLDHILALSLGGSNEDDNLAPACRKCNDEKGRDERRYLERGQDVRDVRLDPAMSKWFRLAGA